jgi:hypothetical protein
MSSEELKPCPVCGCEERGQGGYLRCECPSPTPASTDESALYSQLAGLLEKAREYVTDALEAMEHSDGRDLLAQIDAATLLLRGKGIGAYDADLFHNRGRQGYVRDIYADQFIHRNTAVKEMQARITQLEATQLGMHDLIEQQRQEIERLEERTLFYRRQWGQERKACHEARVAAEGWQLRYYAKAALEEKP